MLFALLSYAKVQARQPLKPAVKDTVAVEMTDTKGKTKTIRLRLKFPGGTGNTGSSGQSKVLADLSKALKDKGVVCPPKRQKIADNVWICGDGTKYISTNKKLTALLEELWKENE